jgi:hypothetical protein
METCRTSFFKTQIVPRICGFNHHVGGLPASKEDMQLLHNYFIAWINLAEDVMIHSSISEASRKRRITNLVDVIGLLDATKILMICQDAATILIDGSVDSYGGFQARLSESHLVPITVMGRLLSPVNPLLVALFECPDCKSESLKDLLQFFRFGKKLNFTGLDLEKEALAGYVETEERLGTVIIDADSDLIKGMNRLMRGWLHDLHFEDMIPAHGSGSVAEGNLTTYDKYHTLGIDALLRLVLGPNWSDYYPCPKVDAFDRLSKVVFVPKTFSKLRTISMEPATLQYFQQGVMQLLYKYIGTHPYLGRRVKLRDQAQNQEYAYRGSIDNSLSTIDLSAASDSVSWSLVKCVFRGTPILRWLYATRSRETLLPNGERRALLKYAPMGSALCFPIQCLLYTSLIEYVSQKWCQTHKHSKNDYSVFGDDLVVPTAIVEEVTNALTSIGFLVNEEKSFVDGPFRESCGKDYYDGIDVSSVYYRLPAYDIHNLSPSVFSSICSCANLAHVQNLPNLRKYYINTLLRSNCSKVYFSNTPLESPALYSEFPTNYHVGSVWNKDYQRKSSRFCSVQSRRKKLKDTRIVPEVEYFDALLRLSRRSIDQREWNEVSIALSATEESASANTLHGVLTLLGSVEREVSD